MAGDIHAGAVHHMRQVEPRQHVLDQLLPNSRFMKLFATISPTKPATAPSCRPAQVEEPLDERRASPYFMWQLSYISRYASRIAGSFGVM